MAEFQTFDGIRLIYEVHGEGEPVVLLHGFAADSFINWEQPGVVAALTEAGYSVIALDARGHGRSDKPHEEAAYANRAMVKDVQILLDELSLDRSKVIGYSMGALVTLGLLTDEPRVSAAVIGGMGDRALGPMDHGDIPEALIADDPSLFSENAQEYRAFADATQADRQALFAAMRAGAEPADPAVLKKIRTPVLVICGDGDTVVGDPAELAGALGNASSVVVEGDHLSAVTDPLFAKSMIKFLDAN
ncbi:MAG TPA: alpha/beta hydrolase [Actinomycetota bacterium]|nr:alpha/beta hydrolase [Actinomycetota bacterium]